MRLRRISYTYWYNRVWRKQSEYHFIIYKSINDKDEIIENLRADKEELKGQLHKFKELWRSLLKRFQEMIGFNNVWKIRTFDWLKIYL